MSGNPAVDMQKWVGFTFAISEPIGAVGNPPRSGQDRKRRRKGPPEGKREIRDESEAGKRQPEYFSLHL